VAAATSRFFSLRYFTALSHIEHSHCMRGLCRYLSQEMGLPCAVAAVNIAMWSDNLECLKLLLERQATDNNPSVQFTAWNKFDVDVAARMGFAECIALAVKHGCPWYREVRGSTPGYACRRGLGYFFSWRDVEFRLSIMCIFNSSNSTRERMVGFQLTDVSL
jgi:hypothetical protein